MIKVNVTKLLPYFLALVLTIVVIYGPSIAGVGFISDDFTLLSNAGSHNFFSPMEGHHYSLLINTLFKLSTKGVIGPPFFHGVALLLHGINSCLILFFMTSCLDISKEKSFVSALLFAINPAGVEALVWCCAVPYTAITSITLISMIIYANHLSMPYSSRISTSILLTSLLILGFLVWDWAILILPILVAIALLLPKKTNFLDELKLLTLPTLAFLTIVILKKVLGMSLGYYFNSFSHVFGIIFLSPFVGIAPIFSKAFYSSLIGITLALTTFSIFLWASTQSKEGLLLFTVFILSQIPQALFGHPQSRYFYFSSFALYATLIIAIPKFPKYALATALLTFASIAYYRIELWKQGSSVAQKMLEDINHAINQHNSKIAIINLPDTYGSESIIWKPFLWRSGRDIFRGMITDKADNHLPTYYIDANYNLIEGRP
ncbi:MAG: hypothetical protein VX777_02810 [Chlamydiota bacterium]|nr:hypothetical protein [Chlamydiota bacterium]